MNNKKNYISSVIVSLLAGFIYYQFGTNIQETVEKVFSSHELIMNVPSNNEFDPAGFKNPQKKKEVKALNKKTKLKNSPEIYFAESHSEVIFDENRAKYRKAVPDRKEDFTDELNKLIRTGKISPDLRNSIRRSSDNNSTADVNSSEMKIQKSVINKDCPSANVIKDKYTGNGFEYNYFFKTDASFYKKYIKKYRGSSSEEPDEDCCSANTVHIVKTECKSKNNVTVKVKCSSGDNEIFIETESLEEETF
ncbi:MAG: hypothetical protein JSS91_09010 [Bacteroidetes bacterium]|nr:hypothetical protein [Bacteroidota bacterium]